MRILIIEDELMFFELYRAMLSEHDVEIRSDGRDIDLTLVGKDLVISDYDVPHYSFEGMRMICESKNIPIILTTGHTESLYKHQLGKPFRKEQLFRMIQEVSSSLGKATS